MHQNTCRVLFLRKEEIDTPLPQNGFRNAIGTIITASLFWLHGHTVWFVATVDVDEISGCFDGLYKVEVLRGWASHHFQWTVSFVKKKWGTLVRNRLSGNFCRAEMRPKSE